MRISVLPIYLATTHSPYDQLAQKPPDTIAKGTATVAGYPFEYSCCSSKNCLPPLL